MPDIEPVERPAAAVASALELGELDTLPSEVVEGVGEIGQYLKQVIESRGLKPTQSSYTDMLTDLKYEMGLDPDASAEATVERLAGVINAWKKLSFLRDPHEKRAMFMKLARASDTSEMNRIVFEGMEAHKVWQ